MSECSFTAVRDEKLCDGCVYTYCQHARKGEVKQMDLLKDMGKRFRELRESKGYTARDICYFTGVDASILCRIEHGLQMFPISLYDDIFRECGTSFSEFMSVYRWTYTEPEKQSRNHESEVIFNDYYKNVS